MGTALARDVNARLPFAKFHGAGNDFVVVDADAVGGDVDLSRLARTLCDRHRGVGADGLLIATGAPGHAPRMAIFNADGSEDTMCGNGVRCVIRYLVDAGKATSEGVVHTASGGVRYRVHGNGDIEVELTDPDWSPAGIPTTLPESQGVEVAGLRMDLVNTGSAHAVVLVDRAPGPDEWASRSRLIETHPVFPERVSVMWTTIEARDRVRIAIWERGVGETLACGTGAVAAVVASARRGLVDTNVEVVSPGGVVRVRWDGEGTPPRLAGPATRVFDGVFPFRFPRRDAGRDLGDHDASGTMPA